MEALVQILANNSFVIYCKKPLPVGRSLKYGYKEFGVDYYFATKNGLDSFKKLGITWKFMKRGVGNVELKNSLNSLV